MENELANDIKGMLSIKSDDLESLPGEFQVLEEGEQSSEDRTSITDSREQPTSGEAPAVPPTPEQEPQPTIDERYAALLNLYNESQSKLLELEQRLSPSQVKHPEPISEVAPTPPVPQAPVMMDRKEMKGLIEKAIIEDDAEALYSVLDKVLEHVEKFDKNAIREEVLRGVPDLANRAASQQYALIKAVDEFYTNNPDLKPHMPLLGGLLNRIAAAEPNLTLVQVLDKTEQEARKVLGLRKQIIAAQPKAAPAFAKPGTTRKPTPPPLEGLQGELAAMARAHGKNE